MRIVSSVKILNAFLFVGGRNTCTGKAKPGPFILERSIEDPSLYFGHMNNQIQGNSCPFLLLLTVYYCSNGIL